MIDYGISLTRETGDSCIIRTSEIAVILGKEKGAKIILRSGASVSVAESPQEIVDIMLREEKRLRKPQTEE